MSDKDPPFTPEGTVGPFYPGVFAAAMKTDLSTVAPLLVHRPAGECVSLSGRFLDSGGLPVRSVIIEAWQANAFGRYRSPRDTSSRPLDPHFEGFARLRTDGEGRYHLITIKPGPHPVPGGSVMRAPHLRLSIFVSGIDRIVTHVFFEGEALNDTDPVLSSIPDPDVRRRLIARRAVEPADPGVTAYTLDIVMRGRGETPFFDDWY